MRKTRPFLNSYPSIFSYLEIGAIEFFLCYQNIILVRPPDLVSCMEAVKLRCSVVESLQGLPGKAIHYALSRWPKLVRYLENGHIAPDNNVVENTIRASAQGRKDRLFRRQPGRSRCGGDTL